MSKIINFIDNSIQTSGITNLSNYDILAFVLEYKERIVVVFWKFKFTSYDNCGSRRHPIYKNSIEVLETKKIISTNLKYSKTSTEIDAELKTQAQLFTILNNPKVLILINKQPIVSQNCTKRCTVFPVLGKLSDLFRINLTPEWFCEQTNIKWT